VNKNRNKKYTVALLDDMLPPYRIPLYEYLNTVNSTFNLEIILSSLKQNDRSWSIDKNKLSSPIHILDGFYINIKTKFSRMGNYHLHINFGILNLLFKKNYDAVIISGYSSLTHQISIILCKILGIPVILWYRSFSESSSFLRKILNIYLYRLIKMPSYYVVPGTKSESYLVKVGISKNKISKIANTVDNNYFSTQYSKLLKNKKLKVKKRITILFVGRLMESKGIWELFNAMSLINSIDRTNKVELKIVGDGILSNQLKLWVDKHDLINIHFLGHLDKDDLCYEYFNADIFVLPSHYEPWGLVVNEAMIFHLPIIATNTIGAADEIIFNNKNGYLIEPKNSNLLASKLKALINDKSKRISMGKESAKIIKEIDHIKSGDIILETFYKIFSN
jgi:glycosyltransferase involved in cell wall biosynthesis